MPVRPGEKVYVDLEESDLVRLVVIAYGFPLTGFLAGAAAGWLFLAGPWQTFAAVFLASAGLMAGVWFGRRLLARMHPGLPAMFAIDAQTAASRYD
jgi:positive regulator of sigma E activity